MYKNGEIEIVMESFEKSLQQSTIYIGCKIIKAERKEIQLESGRISKRYANGIYYENGNINNMFLMFLHGYALGKSMSL